MRLILRVPGLACLLFAGEPVDTDHRGDQTVSLSCEAVVPPSDSGSGRIGGVAPGWTGRLAWTDGRPGQFLLRDPDGRVSPAAGNESLSRLVCREKPEKE